MSEFVDIADMDNLKKTFLESGISKFIFNHAAELSSYGFTACNIALSAKEGLHPDLESGAGFLWLVAGACLRLGDKYPDLAFRLSGAGVIAGAILLAASGVHGGHIDWWKTISPLLGYGTTGSLLLFQKEIASFADRYQDSKSRIILAFCQMARYPVVASAIIDVMGSAGVLKSAHNHHDHMNEAIFSTYILADVALAASDPRAQERFREVETKSIVYSAALQAK